MKQFFNIVLPMAGKGSRFQEQGYTDSKPFIDVNGKPMIQRVIENLNIKFDKKFKFIILCQKSDYDKYDFSIFEKIIGHSNIEIIKLDKTTEGAACTLLEAKKFIDKNFLDRYNDYISIDKYYLEYEPIYQLYYSLLNVYLWDRSFVKNVHNLLERIKT